MTQLEDLKPGVGIKGILPGQSVAVVDVKWHGSSAVELVYRRADGNWVKRLVDPYGLVAKTSVWYLVAGAMRGIFTYRVSRIQEAEITGSSFERPVDFDLPGYWATWCADFEAQHDQYEVTLRVPPKGIPLLIQIFGEGIHTIVEQSGGTDDKGCCKLTLTFESPDDACRKLLGLGTAIEIIKPEELRKQMANTAQQLAALYEN